MPQDRAGRFRVRRPDPLTAVALLALGVLIGLALSEWWPGQAACSALGRLSWISLVGAVCPL